MTWLRPRRGRCRDEGASCEVRGHEPDAQDGDERERAGQERERGHGEPGDGREASAPQHAFREQHGEGERGRYMRVREGQPGDVEPAEPERRGGDAGRRRS